MTNPLDDPRTVAVAGDWHGDVTWGVAAIHHAAELGARAVLHVGDFGYLFRPRFLDGLTKALNDTTMHLMFVDGNHENHRYLARLPLHPNGLRPMSNRIWHIPRGFRWTWAGVDFVGLGGAHSVDGRRRRREGDLWQPEERITDDQALAVMHAGSADVLLSHDCPAGVPIPGLTPGKWDYIELMRAEEHRALLRTVVTAVQPRWIWHGHYHVRYKAEVDLGYGPVAVTGMDENATTLDRNVELVDLELLAAMKGGQDAPRRVHRIRGR